MSYVLSLSSVQLYHFQADLIWPESIFKRKNIQLFIYKLEGSNTFYVGVI